MQAQQGRRAIEVYGHTEDVSETLYQMTVKEIQIVFCIIVSCCCFQGSSYSELGELTNRLQDLAVKRTQQRGFATWIFNYQRDTIDTAWEFGVSFGTTGEGNWRLVAIFFYLFI